MKYSDLEKYRDESGFIQFDLVVNDLGKPYREVRGNDDREKDWYGLEDTDILVRTSCFEEVTNYSEYAELITSELAKQVGLKVAEYDLVKYKDKIGVISDNFLGKGEEFYSMYDVVGEDGTDMFETSSSIMHVIDKLQELKANGDNEFGLKFKAEDIKKINLDFAKMIVFDTFVMSNDRHYKNFGIVTKQDGGIEFAPIFDNEISLMLDTPIEFINEIIDNPESIDIYAENQIQVLKFNEDGGTDSEWRNTIGDLCNSSRIQEFAEKCYQTLDIEKAIQTVEEKIGCEIPSLAKEFVTKGFNARKKLINQEMEFELDEQELDDVEL